MKNIITKEALLNKTKNGLYIYKYFLPNLNINKSKISTNSPFREDRNPSLSIFFGKDRYNFHDHGHTEHRGDCFDFAKQWYKIKYNLDLKFNEVLDKLYNDMNLKNVTEFEPPKNLTQNNSLFENEIEQIKEFNLFERPFSKDDLKYFSQYNITEQILKENSVVAITGYTHRNNEMQNWKQQNFFNMTFAFKGINYKKKKSYAKIYTPNPKSFAWVGEKPADYLFGSELLPGNYSGNNELIILTAGEKDALTLMALGYRALSLSSETFNAPENLKDQMYENYLRLVVLYDIDETGLKRGKELSKQLDCRNIILPEKLKEKGGKDVSDWVKLGLSIEELKNIIDDANNEFEENLPISNIETADQNDFSNIEKNSKEENSQHVISADKLLNYKIENIPTLIDPIFPAVGLAALGGSSDTGKSSILRQLTTSICLKEKFFLDFPINAKYNSCIYVSTEDDEYAISFLLNKQNQEKQQLPEKYKNLRYIFNSEKIIEKLDQELTKAPSDLLVVDAYADIFLGEVNQVNKVRGFLEEYSNLAKKHKCLIIFLHHTSKNSENKEPSKNNLLGSQGFEAKMRLVVELRQDPVEDNLRHFCIVKGNYLPKEHKTESYELSFNSNMIFQNTGNRVPFPELLKLDDDEIDKVELVKEIQTLKGQGLSIRDIANKTGVSKTKVHRLTKS